MMGSPLNRQSKIVMPYIPKNSRGAEIGVWMGNTSVQFLRRNPKMFYMVDPWAVEPYKEADGAEHGSYETYLDKYKHIVGSDNPDDFQKYYDKVYRTVCSKVYGMPNVKVLRKTSTEFFESFQDEKLDWIYIDGDHSYNGVMNDLKGALTVLKPNGYIFGDDYGFGKKEVTAAVNDFVKENGFEFIQFDLDLSHKSSQYRIKL